ncbi:MAG: hypothetical protein FJ095_13545 [Deltaproteobacteria bacterium]|nr:hypothetical protein [Deltaproteobacteria bacterium]
MLRRLTTRSLLLGALGACSEDDLIVPPTGPMGPVSFAVVSPSDGDCVAIGDDVRARVPVLISTENFLLRPPGACGSAAQCGYVRLRADGRDNQLAASRALELDLGKLAQPYRDGSIHPGTGAPYLLELELTLLGDDGEPWLDAEGSPLSASLAIAVKHTCD